MPTRRRKSKKNADQTDSSTITPDKASMRPSGRMAVTSSLDSITVTPRTPRTPRTMNGNRLGSSGVDDDDDVELSLLGEEERRQAAHGLEPDEPEHSPSLKGPMSSKDKRAMVLLCVLCALYFFGLISPELTLSISRPHTGRSSKIPPQPTFYEDH